MLDESKSAPLADQPSPDDGRVETAETTKPGDKTLGFQVADLVEDARKLAYAEIEYYRAKLSVNMTATKSVLALFGIAVALGMATIIALLLGILMVTSHYVGPVAATGLVAGSGFLLTTILMGMAIKRARKLPLDEGDE